MSDEQVGFTITRDTAHEALKPHFDRLAKCIRGGWNRWCQLRDERSDLAAPLNSSTRAGYVNDHIWDEVKKRFKDVSGTHIVEHKRLKLLVIEDQITLRFKKLDKRLHSKNVQTHQQRALGQQLPIEGIPPLVRLTIGYVLSKLETDIEIIAVTLPVDNTIEWHLIVDTTETEIAVLPFTSEDVTTTRVRRVKVKKADQDTALRAENE
jgi:hypothetical protein